MFGRSVRTAIGVVGSCALVAPVAQAGPAPVVPTPPKQAEAVGYGGAVSSVDPDATQAGLDVLRRGGNATDAAVAVAAALGVTEPYSAGIGGGGYFAHYDAKTHRVDTIDGRETAPASGRPDMFQENGKPLPFGEAVTSGLSVGVPGTAATWQAALNRWGSRDLGQVLRPAEKLARDGFRVDRTFRDETAQNQQRFSAFPATRDLFLPGGQPPAVGSVLRNPDLATTYRTLGQQGLGPFYRGPIGADIARTVQHPQVDPASGLTARPGGMTADDLAKYRAEPARPTRATYRGLDIYGMGGSSGGGLTNTEALNILGRSDLSKESKADYLHHFLEASKVAYADRNRWMGDPKFVDEPSRQLQSQRFADSRACLIKPNAVLPTPVAPGDPHHPQDCRAGTQPSQQREGPNTTHLTVSDAAGNVVSYTLTIEQTGGSGMVVPHRGFLLNNELTDFDFAPSSPGQPDPNLPAAGKRPRSSMSPTIALAGGKPLFATGSPGGATITTTVLQVLLGRIDRGESLEQAIAEPRVSEQNKAQAAAEPAFLSSPEAKALQDLGHRFGNGGEIGAATGVERLPDGRWVAAAEPQRRGGGSAAAVVPTGGR
jgi:gamma-glutamyltranspeptidase/glutathione hydrolase